MENKKGALWGIAVLTIVFLLSMSYFALALYYKDGFSYGTWINGIYCTGKSVEAVNIELREATDIEDFRITDRYGNVSVIKLDNFSYDFDYTSQLEMFLQKQNPLLWIDNITMHKVKTLKPSATFDEEKVRHAVLECESITYESTRTQEVKITKGSHGYELYNGMTKVLDIEAAAALVIEAMENGESAIDLAAAGCYQDKELSASMQETLALWQKIETFQTCGIVYDMGDALVPVDTAVTAEWISLDDNGKFLLDDSGQLIFREKGVDEFISALAEEYDTYGGERIFHATRGEEITISGGIYGNQLDQKAERAYLIQAFKEGRTETRIPIYTKQALIRGKNDIGDTYIEIDMKEQKLYYYVSGELTLETEIVTGDERMKWSTPSGVNYVYSKQRNRILRGPGYASPVKYWMPVKGGIGIHDASWRSEFGGEIYKRNGSHGCINLPPKVTPQLYDSVEIGTPVVMFY